MNTVIMDAVNNSIMEYSDEPFDPDTLKLVLKDALETLEVWAAGKKLRELKKEDTKCLRDILKTKASLKAFHDGCMHFSDTWWKERKCPEMDTESQELASLFYKWAGGLKTWRFTQFVEARPQAHKDREGYAVYLPNGKMTWLLKEEFEPYAREVNTTRKIEARVV